MAQLIIGTRDLRPRFKRLEQGRQVLVVFDAYYSGESVRSIRAQSIGALAPRGVPKSEVVFDNLEDLTQLGNYAPEVDDAAYPYQNVVYISASSMREEALDLVPPKDDTLGGQPHGALTDALLRGLSGEANTNGDEKMTTRELYRYVKRWVSSRHRQTPQLLHSENAVLDQSMLGEITSKPSIPSLIRVNQPLRVGLQHNVAELRDEIAALDGVEVSEKNSDVRIKWDRVYKLYLANGEFLDLHRSPHGLLRRIQA